MESMSRTAMLEFRESCKNKIIHKFITASKMYQFIGVVQKVTFTNDKLSSNTETEIDRVARKGTCSISRLHWWVDLFRCLY